MISQCLISFGSNLGHRDEVIAEAARLVANEATVEGLRTSRLFETPPIGGPSGQEPFLNAIATFETRSSARDVLAMLQHFEQTLGRQRRRRWDARSIDLDVVLHGELVGGGHGLIVPHPRYTARQFVLQPACDVAANYRDPRFGWTLRELTDHVSTGAASMALVGGDAATRHQLCERLAREHGIRVFADRDVPEPMPVLGNAPGFLQSLEAATDDGDNSTATVKTRRTNPELIEASDSTPWVAAFAPPLPPLDSPQTRDSTLPRLITRLQWSSPETRWPAPHQMWPTGWRWPEYRLEMDDMDWAVGEVVSALESMRCPCKPVTEDGNWWK